MFNGKGYIKPLHLCIIIIKIIFYLLIFMRYNCLFFYNENYHFYYKLLILNLFSILVVIYQHFRINHLIKNVQQIKIVLIWKKKLYHPMEHFIWYKLFKYFKYGFKFLKLPNIQLLIRFKEKILMVMFGESLCIVYISEHH